MERARRAAGLVLLAAMTLVACRSDETIARESFGSSYSCPEDRITITPRKDLRAVDLATEPKVPPRDIAADPGRLAIWKQSEAARVSEYEGLSVLEVKGCGKDIYDLCGDLRVSVGATRHGCMMAPHPPSEAVR